LAKTWEVRVADWGGPGRGLGSKGGPGRGFWEVRVADFDQKKSKYAVKTVLYAKPPSPYPFLNPLTYFNLP